MTALMQEVVERVHALPYDRQDDVVSKFLGIVSQEEESVPYDDMDVAYVEIADDLTDEERADMAAMRKEYKEHPENFISLDALLAKHGIRREDCHPAKIVYNI